MTHISYKTAKMLKEFLGESVPKPITHEWWNNAFNRQEIIRIKFITGHENAWNIPAYQLQDLLSKPFCEAINGVLLRGEKSGAAFGIHTELSKAYYYGGMEAVEKELVRMMEGK